MVLSSQRSRPRRHQDARLDLAARPHHPEALLIGLVPRLEDWVDRTAARLTQPGTGTVTDVFSQPVGEPALLAPDSMAWQVFKNPATALIGGIAAVVLELGEPSVRSGVYEHSAFRSDPLQRLRRTGHAAMVTIYAARSVAQAKAMQVQAMHARVSGTTPSGRAYRATDPDLLRWVHATASWGFLMARDRYVATVDERDRDLYYAESAAPAALYGAADVPASAADMSALLDVMLPRLEASPLIFEFLGLMNVLPLFPRPVAFLQRWMVRAAVQLLPGPFRQRLELGDAWSLSPMRGAAVRAVVRQVDLMNLKRSAAVRACVRLNLPETHLSRPRPSR